MSNAWLQTRAGIEHISSIHCTHCVSASYSGTCKAIEIDIQMTYRVLWMPWSSKSQSALSIIQFTSYLASISTKSYWEKYQQNNL